jgi:lipopolysaccharide/colanic/teichoic acid biosynthesis glycosyltransferase
MYDDAVGICGRPELGAFGLQDQQYMNYAHHGWDQTKRLLDIAVAATLLVIMFPLLIAIAVGIKLDSKGSILFGQSRRGLYGKPFKMYKFWAMFAKEQDDHAIQQSCRNEPRITRFGSVLRKYSLDELPQIFNVLRGDMSFVGPHPHAFGTNINGHAFPEICDLYLLRYTVRPGITGWAQVNGHRGVLTESHDLIWRLDYDLFYIQNRSLILDIRIFVMTVLTVLRDRKHLAGCVPTDVPSHLSWSRPIR